MIGVRATVRAGHHAAAVAAATASSMPAPIVATAGRTGRYGARRRSPPLRRPPARRRSHRRAAHRADRPHGRAVGQHHQAQVPAGGAHRREHPELRIRRCASTTKPAAATSDTRSRPTVTSASAARAIAVRVGHRPGLAYQWTVHRGPGRPPACLAAGDQDRHRLRRSACATGVRTNSSCRSAGFSTTSDDQAVVVVRVAPGCRPPPQGAGRPVGHRHLVGGLWIPPLPQREHRCAVGAGGILGRMSTGSKRPGTGTERCSITSTVPNHARAAAIRASSAPASPPGQADEVVSPPEGGVAGGAMFSCSS